MFAPILGFDAIEAETADELTSVSFFFTFPGDLHVSGYTYRRYCGQEFIQVPNEHRVSQQFVIFQSGTKQAFMH